MTLFIYDISLPNHGSLLLKKTLPDNYTNFESISVLPSPTSPDHLDVYLNSEGTQFLHYRLKLFSDLKINPKKLP